MRGQLPLPWSDKISSHIPLKLKGLSLLSLLCPTFTAGSPTGLPTRNPNLDAIFPWCKLSSYPMVMETNSASTLHIHDNCLIVLKLYMLKYQTIYVAKPLCKSNKTRMTIFIKSKLKKKMIRRTLTNIE